MKKIFLSLILLLFSTVFLYSDIFYVDDNSAQDFSSIQEGFDSALVDNGDTLYVYPGDNYGPLEIGDKGLYVCAYQTTGIEISDDDNDEHCIEFTDSCDEPTYFIGFAITGGSDTNGGGIYIGDVLRTIYFEKCTISNNSATNGAGIYINGSNPDIPTVHITNSTIENNSATASGGGIYGETTNLFLNDVEFDDNSAYRGGGIYAYGLWSVYSNRILMHRNSASNSGGAIFMAGDDMSYHSDDITWNKATITENESTSGVGGIYLNNQIYSDLSLVNSIVWDNDGSPQVPAGSTITYSCIENGSTTNHNITDDPEFVSGTTYGLEYWSPCIDAGNRAATYDDPDSSMADMGYKYHEQYKYVWGTGGGIGSGSWKWISYPLLPLDEDDYFLNQGENANTGRVRWHWNDIPDSVAWYQDSSVNIWFYGLDSDSDEFFDYWTGSDPPTDSLTSVKGYKIYRSETGCLPFTRGLECDYDVDVSTYQNFDTWLGYFIEATQSAEDAIPSIVLNDCLKIQTQRWCTSRASTGDPWSKDPDECYINYADMVVMRTARARTFEWNCSREESDPIIRPYAEHFEWEEEIDYLPIYAEFDPEDVPDEIGVYVDGVCQGAEVVNDLICQICAYILFEEPGQEIEFEFWYEGRGKRERRNSYQIHENGFPVSSNTLFTGQPGDFYTVCFDRNEDAVSIPYDLCCYPNPFNPETNISFTIDNESEVVLAVYNIRGQKIRTLANETFRPDEYSIVWNGANDKGNKCGSGVYFVRIKVNDDTYSSKIIMLK